MKCEIPQTNKQKKRTENKEIKNEGNVQEHEDQMSSSRSFKAGKIHFYIFIRQ